MTCFQKRYKISFVNSDIELYCLHFVSKSGWNQKISIYTSTYHFPIWEIWRPRNMQKISAPHCKIRYYCLDSNHPILWGYYFPKENASELISSLTNLSEILTVPMTLKQHTEWKSCIHLSDTRWITLKWIFHQEGYFASTYEAQLMDSNGNIQSWCGTSIETICMFLHHSYKNTRMHLWINSVFGDIQPSLAFVLDLRNQLGLK